MGCYDIEIGRYITSDPIGISGGVNIYSYVKNPIIWIDPLGLYGKICVIDNKREIRPRN